MKRFLILAAAALVLGLGLSNKADAQIIYNVSVPTVSGVEMTRGFITPFESQNVTSFTSGFTGTTIRQSTTTTRAGSVIRTSGFNPVTGGRFRTSVDVPNFNFSNQTRDFNFSNQMREPFMPMMNPFMPMMNPSMGMSRFRR